MSPCPFKVGDRVKVDGMCGRVKKRSPLGDGVVLTIELQGGGIVVRNCADVGPCPAQGVIAICGAPTRDGTPCQRVVRGGQRCHLHKNKPAFHEK